MFVEYCFPFLWKDSGTTKLSLPLVLTNIRFGKSAIHEGIVLSSKLLNKDKKDKLLMWEFVNTIFKYDYI
jgi:hypothetical protein